MAKHFQFLFILASASERRQELLAKAGYTFEVIPSDVDESAFSINGISTTDYAKNLALAKAKDVASRYPESLVMGADTIADFNGEIIGKASDDKEAERIIRKLFSSPHKIITGVALARKSDGFEIIQSDTTIVYPRKMTEEQISSHIQGRTWQGKAGAYGIQEGGDKFIEKIEGSFTNVMGLPMERVEKMLKEAIKE